MVTIQEQFVVKSEYNDKQLNLFSGMDNFTEEDKEHSIDVASDAGALEEVLRMILEIINSTLISQNKSNSNFIYTLLYQQHIFEPFHKHPNFQDLLQNIKTVSVIQKCLQYQLQWTLGLTQWNLHSFEFKFDDTRLFS